MNKIKEIKNGEIEKNKVVQNTPEKIDEKLLLSRREFLELSSKTFLLRSFFPVDFLKKLFTKKEIVKTADSYEIKSDFYEKEIDKIQKDIINDKKERVFGYFAKKTKVGKLIMPDEKFLEYNTMSNALRVFMPLELIKDEIINNSYEQTKLIHTHPLSSYLAGGILNFLEVEKIRNGEIKSPPMPPSFIDISNAMQRISFWGKEINEKIKIENEVIDSTGVWNYSIIDSENDFIKKYLDYIKTAENLNLFLSKEEMEVLKKFGEEHPDLLLSLSTLMFPDIAEQNPEIYKILIKLSDIFAEKSKNIGNENLLFIDEIEKLGMEIAGNAGESNVMLEKRKKDIDVFIKSWVKKGVKIIYKLIRPTE